jgi:hypothetical protein
MTSVSTLSPLLTEPLLQEDAIDSISPSLSNVTNSKIVMAVATSPSSSSSSPPFEWPAEAAERAVLYIPRDDHGGTCHLRYNPLRHLLELVSNEEAGLVLDIMNPNDIIGANIEIKLFPNDNPANHDRFHNSETENQPQKSTAAAMMANIFQPLSNDMDKIFCRADTTISSTNPSNEDGNPNDNNANPSIPWDSTASAILNIFVYPKRELSKRSTWKVVQRLLGLSTNDSTIRTPPITYGHRHAAIRRFHVAAAEDFANISTVVRAIRQLAGQQQQQQIVSSKPYLVLINPKAGPKKNAERVFDQLVQPMLEQAGIDAVKRVTTHARHAEEIVAQESISDYGAIIAMGGDGIVHEILQGLYTKWQQAAQSSNAASTTTTTSLASLRDAFQNLKIGVIGCGTSNGLAKTLLHASEVKHSIIYIEDALIVYHPCLTRRVCGCSTCSMQHVRNYVLSWSQPSSFAKARLRGWTCHTITRYINRMHRS